MGRRLKYFFIYLYRLPSFAVFGLYFLWMLLVANLRITQDVLTPRHRFQPRIIAVAVDVSDDLEMLVLANLISLTPGTLTLDVNWEQQLLYVHASYAAEPGDTVDQIRHDLAARLARLLR